MKWKEAYATGDALVDKQHKSLFAFSEEFREVLDHANGDKTYDLFLEFLNEYAEVHFSFEDSCMMAHRCPIADRNRKEHGSFRRLIETEQHAYTADGFDRARAYALLDQIDHWLDSHIARIDVQLKDSIAAGRQC
ncbi:hemerythrin domain-containing protein [Rhodobacteraceae bacterium D3-12]|nr:hemerythrin domain-containing protein [Rhodobacteraceae bacterium D3-12]